jgi:hypothetical protein
MIIGIKIAPSRSGGRPEPSVFYCGEDGTELRKQHAKLLEKNEEGQSRFFQIVHPLLAPLQHVKHSTEEHPDVIAAQKHRKQLAQGAKAEQAEIPEETADK